MSTPYHEIQSKATSMASKDLECEGRTDDKLPFVVGLCSLEKCGQAAAVTRFALQPTPLVNP